MPLDKPNYQIPLPIELDEVEDSGIPSPDEARARSEAARAMLDGSEKPPRWMEDYLKLRDGGWPWRVAAFIAWESTPKAGRSPKTQLEFAQQVLGLNSDRAIMTWRKKNPMIDETIALLQTSALFEHRAEIFAALVENAKTPDYKTHNDRKLALELLGDYIPTAKLAALLQNHSVNSDELRNMSDAELLQALRQLKQEQGIEDAEEDAE